MRIKRLETFSTRYIAFVRATLEDGSVGWGQLSTYNSDITADVFHRQAAPWVLGEEAWPIDPLIDRIEEKEHKFPGAYLKRAMAGLDTALWDLESKRQEKPVVALLGGKPGRLRTYASSMRRDITPEGEAARFVELRDRFGFDAFKFRVAAEYGHDVDEWPGRTEAIVPAVRRALGPDVALLVDANSGFSPARAIEIGQAARGRGRRAFRGTLPLLGAGADEAGERGAGHRRDRRRAGLRSLDLARHLRAAHRRYRPARRALCRRHRPRPQGGEAGRGRGLKVTPHAANLGLVTLFTMHLLAALPNAGKYLEFSIEGPDYYPWQYGVFRKDPYRVEDGHVTISAEPGWGIEIEPEWLAKSRYQVSEPS